jgi:hypothetical protein
MTSPATCGLWFLAAREAANAIRHAQAAAEAECGRKLRMLCTDNGGEFTAAEFVSYCMDEGVQRHYSAPYSPQQNGVIERRNQTVVWMARALLKQRGMSAVFWGEAVVTAVYILNRSPIKALNGRTPYEAWHGCKPAVSHHGSSAASHSAKSLATSASSTTGALQRCSSATRRAQRPTAFLTQGHSVCARRAT